MSKGYIILAQNNQHTDYLNMAYVLAMSIKATQKEINSVCVCVDKLTLTKMEPKHREVFDHVVEVPTNGSYWKINNKWMFYNLSPYDETIILDADMVFTYPIDDMWDFYKDKYFWACTSARNYRNEEVSKIAYRVKFVHLDLPHIYSNFTYFRKCKKSKYLFELIEDIFLNWKEYYDKYLNGPGQEDLSADLAYSLAIRLSGLENEVYQDDSPVPCFTHMKSKIQNTVMVDDNWEPTMGCVVTDNIKVTVGNYIQINPFHYVMKSWLTEDRINKYEAAYNRWKK